MTWTASCLDCGQSWSSTISADDAAAQRDAHTCPAPAPD